MFGGEVTQGSVRGWLALACAVGAGLLALMLAAGGGSSSAEAATAERAAPMRCPATFRVLHNDRIGELRLRRGHYRIRLLDAETLTCAKASRLFARFLQDFDGRLPGRWRLDVDTQTFERPPNVGFKVRRVRERSGRGGGRHPAKGATKCPTFQVLHNDRIDGVRFRRGTYQMTALGGMECQKASRRFAAFLDAQATTGPWRLKESTGTFLRGQTRRGFQVNFWG